MNFVEFVYIAAAPQMALISTWNAYEIRTSTFCEGRTMWVLKYQSFAGTIYTRNELAFDQTFSDVHITIDEYLKSDSVLFIWSLI